MALPKTRSVHSMNQFIPEYLKDSPIADSFEMNNGKRTSHINPNQSIGIPSLALDEHPASSSKPIRQSRSQISTTLPEEPESLSLSIDPFPIITLPSAWSLKEKCPLLELSRQNLRASYAGAGKSDGDAAAVRANHPIPPQAGLYYFEVEIVSKGRDGYIGIGFCAGNVLLNRLPGWETHSWGYHGDDGHSFDCSGTGKAYGPTFATGDVIGCGVNLMTSSAFYTKNGVHLGTAFRDLPIAKLEAGSGSSSSQENGLTVYPCIGLRTPGEQVEVNFGGKKFKFDIENYFKERRQKIWEIINASPISNPRLNPRLEVSADIRAPADGFSKGTQTGANGQQSSLPFSTLPYGDSTTMSASSGSEGSMYDVLNELVFSYLVHHGYADTASKFAQGIERSTIGLIHNGGSSSLPSAPAKTGTKARRGTVKAPQSSDTTPMLLDIDMSRSEISTTDFDGSSSKGDTTDTGIDPSPRPPERNVRMRTISARDDDEVCDEIRNRQRIREHILDGDVDNAIELTNKLYPKVLSDNPKILFQLRCRKFVEMMARINIPASTPKVATKRNAASSRASPQVRSRIASRTRGSSNGVAVMEVDDEEHSDKSSPWVIAEEGRDSDHNEDDDSADDFHSPVEDPASDIGEELPEPHKTKQAAKNPHVKGEVRVEEALEYGKKLDEDYRNDSDESVRNALVETFSLLAYTDLSKSPVSYLLDPSRRLMVADALNSAILVSRGQPPIPPVEVLFRQTVAVQRELLRYGIGAGGFYNIKKELLKQ